MAGLKGKAACIAWYNDNLRVGDALRQAREFGYPGMTLRILVARTLPMYPRRLANALSHYHHCNVTVRQSSKPPTRPALDETGGALVPYVHTVEITYSW